MDLKIFLAESKYIDFSSPNIQKKAAEIFQQTSTNTEYAKAAYEYVRDKIAHTFDIAIKPFRATAKASDVLKHGTGICHAKSNLLAALLRSRGIPTGFCFQHITLEDDDSAGYCIHCYNAIFLDIDPPIEVCQANSNHPPKRGDCDTNIAERFNWCRNNQWVKVDARGNRPGVNARFSLGEPVLAFSCRPEYDEYFLPGIYANPHFDTMEMLENAKSLQDILDNIPDYLHEKPDCIVSQ